MVLEQKRSHLETLDWMDEMAYFSAELHPNKVGLNGYIKLLISWGKKDILGCEALVWQNN